MKDLIDSIYDFDIANYTGINKRAISKEKIQDLLDIMDIDCVVSFGAFFQFKDPFIKFAKLYRDIYVFNMDIEQAFKSI